MKKSVDYFKMLKLLSEYVSIIYINVINNKDFSSERIDFIALKSELINSLQNEFITPLERGDIFLLAENLSNELDSVFCLQEYLMLVNIKELNELNVISAFFTNQNDVFCRLKNFSGNIRLFEQCSDAIHSINRFQKDNEKHIVEILCCKREQPLINYAVLSAIIDLNRKIYKTFIEIERIIINS